MGNNIFGGLGSLIGMGAQNVLPGISSAQQANQGQYTNISNNNAIIGGPYGIQQQISAPVDLTKILNDKDSYLTEQKNKISNNLKQLEVEHQKLTSLMDSIRPETKEILGLIGDNFYPNSTLQFNNNKLIEFVEQLNKVVINNEFNKKVEDIINE